MRKNYTLSLDKERVEKLQPWLEKKGLTFSGYVDSLIEESMIAVEKFKVPEDITKMKVRDFLFIAKRMMGDLKNEAKK
jgi:hypothetical protein